MIPEPGGMTVRFDVVCHDSTAVVRVKVNTRGSQLDPDGYLVTLDDGPAHAIDVIDSVSFPSVVPGIHYLQLNGVASDCAVLGPNPQAVIVRELSGATITFTVNCVDRDRLGGLHVDIRATGLPIVRPLYVKLDGPGGTRSAPPGLFTGLPDGAYQVTLRSQSPFFGLECNIQGPNPRTVAITRGAIVTTVFEVYCDY